MKRSRALIFAGILVICVGCDHATKHIAQDALMGSASISLVGDTLRFELVHNPGAFLSVGAGLPSEVRQFLFLGLVPLGLAIICGLALRSSSPSGCTLLGVALIAGGGLGNWLDRLQHGGAVTDFVSLGLGPLRTGIFNLSDVCIMAGVALLFIAPRRSGGPRGQAA
jgi:signal peptidase II